MHSDTSSVKKGNKSRMEKDRKLTIMVGVMVKPKVFSITLTFLSKTISFFVVWSPYAMHVSQLLRHLGSSPLLPTPTTY